MKPKCYDCGDVCTRDYFYADILSEDGNLMTLPIHTVCYKRATKGGKPVYPERGTE